MAAFPSGSDPHHPGTQRKLGYKLISIVNVLSLAVLLTIMQAVPPTPRKTADTAAGRGDAVKKDSATKQAPAAPLPVQDAPSATEQQKSGNAPPDADRQETIRVRELPAVSVSKDWWDRSAIILTGCLVLIGGVGSLFALRTLTAIQLQTATIIESQRPQIAAIAYGNPMVDVLSAQPRVVIELSNKGLTTAHQLIYETWIEVLPHPFVDFTQSAIRHKSADPALLQPSSPLQLNIPLNGGLTQQQRASIRDLTQDVCIRILVNYRDAFNPSRRVSFGFCVRFNGLAPLPKYNGEC